ncbi:MULTISPECIES: helix-turn-helix domain-containing protein [unclassified Streptomyces]|uniref:helix-turn-helix domain-containing protein n=1 Tax=unclassified Streptomyces TaxID=2593676 RepID=UPI003830099B
MPDRARVIPLRPTAHRPPAHRSEPPRRETPRPGFARPEPAGPVVPRPEPGPPVPRAPREPLWRDLVGDVLRRERRAQGRTLKDVADTARISMPYLSEVERGRKEASSEVLAAAAHALGLTLGDLLARAQGELVRVTGQISGPLTGQVGSQVTGRAAPTAHGGPSSSYDGLCLVA